MVAPVTGEYEELVLEVEDELASSPGTYIKICGLMGFTFNRKANLDTVEVPADCDDESLPYDVRKSVRSLDFGVSGEATWAQQSHEMLLDWFYSGAAKNVRIRHVAVEVGDTEYEAGSALLTDFPTERAKGAKLTGKIELVFDGTPTRTPKAS